MILHRIQSGGFSDRVIHGGIAFLVLLFTGFLFLMFTIWGLTAGGVRVEAELRRQLPELVVSSDAGAEELPDEIVLSLSETDMASLNDEPVDDLPAALAQLRKSTGGRQMIVTVAAHPQTSFGAITTAFDLLKQAGLGNATLVVEAEEGF